MMSSNLGVWGEQVDEIMAEAATYFEQGHLQGLVHLEDSICRWLPQSPCPNAVCLALEFVRAALDTVVPGPQPFQPELMRLTDYRQAWQDERERMLERRARLAELREQQAGRSSNWLYE